MKTARWWSSSSQRLRTGLAGGRGAGRWSSRCLRTCSTSRRVFSFVTFCAEGFLPRVAHVITAQPHCRLSICVCRLVTNRRGRRPIQSLFRGHGAADAGSSIGMHPVIALPNGESICTELSSEGEHTCMNVGTNSEQFDFLDSLKLRLKRVVSVEKANCGAFCSPCIAHPNQHHRDRPRTCGGCPQTICVLRHQVCRPAVLGVRGILRQLPVAISEPPPRPQLCQHC